jgi:hypothetical protein
VVVYTAVQFYSQLGKNSPILYVPLGIVLMLLLMYTVMLPLLYPLIVGYKLSFVNVYRNGILMASASLPLMLLSRIITFIPVFFLGFGILTGHPVMVMICTLYYVFFGFAMSRLIYASFANGIFDKYLNPRIEGAQVGQGLRPAGYEEIDVDDEDDEEETGTSGKAEGGEKPSGLKGLLNSRKQEDGGAGKKAETDGKHSGLRGLLNRKKQDEDYDDIDEDDDEDE